VKSNDAVIDCETLCQWKVSFRIPYEGITWWMVRVGKYVQRLGCTERIPVIIFWRDTILIKWTVIRAFPILYGIRTCIDDRMMMMMGILYSRKRNTLSVPPTTTTILYCPKWKCCCCCCACLVGHHSGFPILTRTSFSGGNIRCNMTWLLWMDLELTVGTT
jgi:hypothetical protein